MICMNIVLTFLIFNFGLNLDMSLESQFKINNSHTFLIGNFKKTLYNDWGMHLNINEYFQSIKKFKEVERIGLLEGSGSVIQPEINLNIKAKYKEKDKIVLDYVFDNSTGLIYYLVDDGIKVLQFNFSSEENFIALKENYIFKNKSHKYQSMYLVNMDKGIKLMVIFCQKSILYSSNITNPFKINSFLNIDEEITFTPTMNLQVYKEYLFIPSQSLGLLVFKYENSSLKFFSSLFKLSTKVSPVNITSVLIVNETEKKMLVADSNLGLFISNFSIIDNSISIFVSNNYSIHGIKNIQFVNLNPSPIIVLLAETSGVSNYYELSYNNVSENIKIRRIVPLQSKADSLISLEKYSSIIMENLQTIIKVGSDMNHQILTIPKIYDSEILIFKDNPYLLTATKNEFIFSSIYETPPMIEISFNQTNFTKILVADFSHTCLIGNDISNLTVEYIDDIHCKYVAQIDLIKTTTDIESKNVNTFFVYGSLIIIAASIIFVIIIIIIYVKYKKVKNEYTRLYTETQKITEQQSAKEPADTPNPDTKNRFDLRQMKQFH